MGSSTNRTILREQSFEFGSETFKGDAFGYPRFDSDRMFENVASRYLATIQNTGNNYIDLTNIHPCYSETKKMF